MKGFHYIICMGPTQSGPHPHPLPYFQNVGGFVSYMLLKYKFAIDIIDHLLFQKASTYIIHYIMYHHSHLLERDGSDLIYLFCHYNRKDLLKSYEHFFNDIEVLQLYFEDSIYTTFNLFKTAFRIMEKRMGNNMINSKNNYIKKICNRVYSKQNTKVTIKNKILKWLLKQFDFDCNICDDLLDDMIIYDQAHIVSWCIQKGFIPQNELQEFTNISVQRYAKKIVELMVSDYGITIDKSIIRKCKDTELLNWLYDHGAVYTKPVAIEGHLILLILLSSILLYFIFKKENISQ